MIVTLILLIAVVLICSYVSARLGVSSYPIETTEDEIKRPTSMYPGL